MASSEIAVVQTPSKPDIADVIATATKLSLILSRDHDDTSDFTSTYNHLVMPNTDAARDRTDHRTS